ncbi:MAG TPA: sigma-70 family RNA polymerase sigma factor [Acetobacteraceae bacterium]|jgi:RNA polymerase sigma factor (sigma-70 family)|nr:sigma-70 family RNA polymerase sigma factor [Acetobacteraceae bacterium]
MDLAHLVRRASDGNVDAFVALTHRFQHLAFGSALALVHDFQLAEDITQEAFITAWSALPKLIDPNAFPGWIRSIVRHHAFRALRRPGLNVVPLTEAADIASEEAAPDRVLEHRQQEAAALAAIAALPARLREPATLFFVHECSQQDIAIFLHLPITTVNNRLHAARMQLKQRMLTMVESTLQSHGLPDDFANRIGRLISASGSRVDALFDPASLPDLLTELLVSDEASKRAVPVQVVQRPGGGIVRGLAAMPIASLRSGATVLSSGRQTETQIHQIGFEHVAPLLAGRASDAAGSKTLVETGIKVIDVMCPLMAGGSVAIAGEPGAGALVLMEELARRLSDRRIPMSLFVVMPPFSPAWPASMQDGFSLGDSLKREGYSEGTIGTVQTFFLRGQEKPWTEDQLSALKAADVVIHLSREVAKAQLYPAVDPRTCCSCLLETKLVDDGHLKVVERVRDALAVLPWDNGHQSLASTPVAVTRAWKLMNFFTQPFFAAECYTRRPGSHVCLHDAVQACDEIIRGQHDDIPLEAFCFAGTMAEIRQQIGRGSPTTCL